MSLDPIRHEYVVGCTPDRAFDTYANRIAEWWDPRYTANPDTFDGVSIEPHVGGEVVETHRGDQRIPWGNVTVWEPGRQLSYTSTLAQTHESPSEITVRFTPDGDRCRVAFEHGGWNEGNKQARSKFQDWPVILARFVALAERLDR